MNCHCVYQEEKRQVKALNETLHVIQAGGEDLVQKVRNYIILQKVHVVFTLQGTAVLYRIPVLRQELILSFLTH